MFHFFVYLFLELFDSGVHLLCDFRMLCCHIVTLLGVGFHVEEGKADVSAFGNLFAGQSVLTGSFYDAVAMRNYAFPFSVAQSFHYAVVYKVERPVSCFLSGKDTPSVLSVEFIHAGHLRLGEIYQCRRDVEGGEELVAHLACGDYARHTDYERYALSAVEGSAFAFTQSAVAAAVITVTQPRAVVGSKHDNSIFVQPVGFQGFHDFAYAPVYFHDYVGIKAFTGFSFELVRYTQWHVRLGIGQIKEERFRFVVVDEPDGTLGQSCGHLVDGSVVFYHTVVVVERQRRIVMVGCRVVRPHIIGIGKTEEFGEAVVQRQIFRLIS